ncbi:PspC domain-containing protein [Phytomonospora sp. NPDC050363]|uniref:PspC domain-containing protein n=1 Tax=Phytomonospora sp. NPDC050363 TaxID=3155642 RepID=UPI0033EFF45E
MTDYAPTSGPQGPAPRGLPRPPLGLVRPKEDAKVAGVCSAIGRATRSDPLLWRVLFAVLILFAGTGLIVYALLWLFTPAEGDTASPLEALFGRGRSSTSAPLTLALGVGVALAAFVVFWDNFPIAVGMGAALILAVVYLVRTEPQRQARMTYPQGYTPPIPPEFTTPPSSPHTPPAGYRAPFAPYGPYAAYTTQSTVHGAKPAEGTEAGPKPFLPPLATPPRYGTPPPPPQRPVYPPPQQPRPPKPRRPRSKLPLAILSAMAVILGVLGIVDLAGASIPFGWYLATALTVSAVGLLIGTWIGRARSMIAIGIVLSLTLMAYTAVTWVVDNVDSGPRKLWAPETVAAIQSSYVYDQVDGTLDLRKVEFTDTDVLTIDIRVDSGSFHVILPPDVDVTANGHVDLGYMNLFGWEHGGSADSVNTDEGADGPGGGEITVNAYVDLGSLEITR